MKHSATATIAAVITLSSGVSTAQERPAERPSVATEPAPPLTVAEDAPDVDLERECTQFEVLEIAVPYYAPVGEAADFEFSVSHDMPHDCLADMVFQVEGLPKSAKFYPDAGPNLATVRWTPRTRDVGIHHVVLSATWKGRVRRDRRVRIDVREEWESYFLPGVQYSGYVPEDRDLGYFQGVSIEYVLVAWIHRNENRGPSHGRWYANVELLNSTEKEVGDMLLYHLGLDLSLERNPRRSFLIPMFGLEGGGAWQQQQGNFAHFTPKAGIHLWSSRNFFLHVTGGYFFPTKELEDLQGWRVKAGLDLALW